MAELSYLANKHVGEMIFERSKETRMSRVDLAHVLGLYPSNLNRFLKKETIDTGKLAEISKAMQYNFFKEFCRTKEYVDTYLKNEDFSINEVHIGSLIEKRMKELHLTQKEFAEKLNAIQNIVNLRQQRISIIVNCPSIDTGLLCHISVLLSCNFFEAYYQESASSVENEKTLVDTIPWEYTKKVQALLVENVDLKHKVNILRRIIKKAGLSEESIKNLGFSSSDILSADLDAEDYDEVLRTALDFWKSKEHG